MKYDRTILNKKCEILFYTFFLLSFTIHPIQAQRDRGGIHDRATIKDKMIYSDTLLVPRNFLKQSVKSDIFYDSLKEKGSRKWLPRLITQALIRSHASVDDIEPAPELEVSRSYFESYAGRTISEIRVIQANIFSRDTAQQLTWAERFVDGLHTLTRPRKIMENLLFHTGDTIQPYTMAINEQLFRSLPYLSTAYFIVRPLEGTKDVEILIFVRDNWTISGNVKYSSNSWVEAYDRNFLGTGNELKLKYMVQQNEQDHAFEVQYNLTNLFGTFTDVKLRAGVGATHNSAKITASRPFILPSDHIWGLEAGYVQDNQYLLTMDTMLNINELNYALWYGYSWNLDPRKGTNIYLAGAANYVRFNKRPPVSPGINPYYYNHITALASLGFARQNFFQGNMIYGYGRTEDIPYGFKFEILGGFSWSEILERRVYMGASALWGDLTRIGYIQAGVETGGFLTEWGKVEQASLTGTLHYFSPLMKVGNTNVRQFLNVVGTWGWNRMMGEREVLHYRRNAGIRGMGNSPYSLGYNRFTIGAETVFFTPIFFYHFRFAFFGWGDFGWLGYKNNVFLNPLTSAAGVGLRIKNERLIFNNIQIRLGFSLKRGREVGFNPFQFSNEEALYLNRFEPLPPRQIQYQ